MHLLYKSFVPSLEMDDKKTGWVGKKLIVYLPIRVTMWVWMVSLSMVAMCTILWKELLIFKKLWTSFEEAIFVILRTVIHIYLYLSVMNAISYYVSVWEHLEVSTHTISAVKFQWYNNLLQWFSNVIAAFPLYYLFLLNCFSTAGTSLAKSNLITTQQAQQLKNSKIAPVLF